MLSKPVAVTGSPTLTLNDGATATYDVNASAPAIGKLVFDYLVGPGDATPNLAVTSVNPGSAITDVNGVSPDFSAALNTPTGLHVGPPTVTSVVAGLPGNGT